MTSEYKHRYISDEEGFSRKNNLVSRSWAAWLMLSLALIIVVIIKQQLTTNLQATAEHHFKTVVSQQAQVLLARMHDYEQVLLGAAGLFAASSEVNREEWRIYVESLQLARSLPGIQGVGYAIMVPPDKKEQHEASMRAEGFPDYAIYPRGEREMYSSIIYLEPFSGRNLRAFSYDMFSEPVRHAAMQRATDTDAPAWSRKVTLVQETGRADQAGFLVYLPVYINDMPTHSKAERRAALKGFVYSPFRAVDMLSSVFNDPYRVFELQLFDDKPSPENLLFESSPNISNASYQTDVMIEIGGAKWTARYFSNDEYDASVDNSLVPLVMAASLSLVGFVFIIMLLDIRHRKRMNDSHYDLQTSIREARLIAKLTEILQNCATVDEAFPIISTTLKNLFPEAPGACYMINDSTSLMSLACRWGEAEHKDKTFFPDECWALKRSQIHTYGFGEYADIKCAHFSADVSRSVCVPLMAQGTILGSLHFPQLMSHSDVQNNLSQQLELLRNIADTISLALANLRLRESLREMSMRDPLTGLYNRRFMEETLVREVNRCIRNDSTLAVVMMDIDNFKDFNDNYGHEAGDIVLKLLAEQLNQFRSGLDVSCRFGGEEFLLILPNIDSENAIKRLEQLRLMIENMEVYFHDKLLPPITTSIGLALFPEHGTDSTTLLHEADSALYKAKSAGRNCIKVAEQ